MGININNKYDLDYLKILFAAVCWSALIYCFIWPINYFIGVDAYYHVKISVIMKKYGIMLSGFPWADCSIWRDNFFDKDWLFHLYLIPFTYFGKLTGGKLAIITAVFISCISWGALLKSLKIKNLFLSLIIMLSCYGFYSRMFMCRGHILSIAFFPLCLLCIIRKKQILLFVITLLYAYAYTGAWQILFLALAYDLYRIILDSEKITIRNSTILPAFLAIFVSLIVNPYFPNNVEGLLIQNFFVLKTKWFGNNDVIINLGSEFNPLTSKKLYTWYLIFFVLIFSTFANFIKDWKKKDLECLYLGSISFLYFTLSLISVKFTDYSVPLGFTFIALFWDKWLTEKKDISRKIRNVIYCLYCILILFIIITVVNNKGDITTVNKKPLYSGAAKWLKSNIAKTEKNITLNPKQIVFTGGWDDAPMLFYGTAQYKYLVFLDPCFMYLYSPEKYKQWYKIIENRTLYPAMMIYKDFKADFVFLSKHRKVLAGVLHQSPYAELCYIGPDEEKIFKINITEKQFAEFKEKNKKIRKYIKEK